MTAQVLASYAVDRGARRHYWSPSAATPAEYYAPEPLTPQQATLYRRLSHRRSVTATIDGRLLRFAISPMAPAREPAADSWLEAATSLDGHPLSLRLSRLMVDRVIAWLDPELATGGLDSAGLWLLVELWLAPSIAVIEAAFSARLDHFRPGSNVATAAAEIVIAVEISVDDEQCGRALFGLDAALAQRLVQSIEAMAPLPAALPDLPVPVAFRIGASELTVAELASLAPGDVILVERRPAIQDDMVVACLGERWFAPARLVGSAAALAAAFRPAATANLEFWTMDNEKASLPPAGAADVPLDELPVKLLFELGTLDLPLGELRVLGVGHIFELGRDLSHPVDIFGNGRRIGQGEIVRIGNAVGVRVLRLFGHG
jgi:type III secretion protein Q